MIWQDKKKVVTYFYKNQYNKRVHMTQLSKIINYLGYENVRSYMK